MKNKILTILAFGALAFSSCSSDDNYAGNNLNYTIPTTYSFERNSATTVDYSGQTARINMLQEMGDYFKLQASTNATIDATKLSSMYSNTANAFTSVALNESGKLLKNKTASSLDYFNLLQGGGTLSEQAAVKNLFEAQFTSGTVASQGNNAAAGIAGKYQDGSSVRLFAANGLEPQEVFLKGMMGASFLDQICNTYLSTNKLDGATVRIDNTNKILVSGSNYTEMEHFWDEAYGYIYGGDNLTATTPSFRYWSSYINQVNADADFNNLKADIELAFRKGRAAITANDYVTRDAQIVLIKEKLAIVTAVRAVYYLQEGKGKLTTDGGAKAFHALSEGYGFILSLRYTNKPGTNNPYFSKSEVDVMLNQFTSGTNGLWDIDALSPKLDALSTQIATKFSFTVTQAATVN